MPNHTILLTGTVGVGKTSVLLELGEALSGRGDAYAIVDLDWLAWLSPSPASGRTVQGVLLDNLRHVASTFGEAGVERLVVARAVRSAGEVDGIRGALGASDLTVVRLVASAAVVEQRLRRRDRGAQLAEHLAEAASFAVEADAAGIGDAVLSTDAADPATVARQVLEAAGWS